MFQRTSGFILRVTAYQDNSQILSVFTKEFGICSFILKRSQSFRANKSALLLLLNQVEIIYLHKEKRDVQLVTEINLLRYYQTFYLETTRAIYLQLWVEVLRSVLLDFGYQPEIYQWLGLFLHQLDELSDTIFERTIIGFAELAQLLGYLPDIDDTWGAQPIRLNEVLGIFEKTTSNNSEIVPTLIINLMLQYRKGTTLTKIPKEYRQRMLQYWFKIFQIHISHFKPPISLTIWESIFKGIKE